MNISNTIEIIGREPGPTIAVLAGVHGNEMAGVIALQELLTSLNITKGRLFIIYANPPAIEANVRMINKNLNRCFYKGNIGKTPEDIRAREIMHLLDQCDALLDLHMFYDDNGLPFVICEDNALDIAQKFEVEIISTNWTEVEPGGTDGYMFLKGKIGICVECGPISKATEYKEFAKKTIYQFLNHYDMTNKELNNSKIPKRIIRASSAVYRNSKCFKLADGFHNFDKLKDGQTIATEQNKQYIANHNECIIFPNYTAQIGEESYIIGFEVL
jgi:succinylglutamate desuccinylase